MKQNINNVIARGKVKWDEIYDSESELLNDLVASGDYERKYTKGYAYLESFKKQYLAKGTLSDKQMVQLKRLAQEVYTNVHWKDSLTNPMFSEFGSR